MQTPLVDNEKMQKLSYALSWKMTKTLIDLPWELSGTVAVNLF